MSDFDINESMGYIIRQVNALIRNRFNKMARELGHNITVEQWAVLHFVNNQPGLTQSEIATIGLKDKTGVTRMIDVLEKNGMVERHTIKNDRRAYSIFITRTGSKVMKELNLLATQINKEGISKLNPKEVEQFLRALNIMYNTFIKVI